MDFPLRDITSAAPDRAGARPVWGSAENRLVSVSGAVTASFAYDGDGKRVKSTIAGMTTYFVGNIYEQTGSTVTKYYYLGGKRVAMRQGSSVYYLLSDHLGSTTVTAGVNGDVVAELRYKPWGEVRSGSAPTSYTFTGQYSSTTDFGLMFYNARWYDPALGRFASADSIVPAGIQGYYRYAYSNNNPVNYTDPTGHFGKHRDDKSDYWNKRNQHKVKNLEAKWEKEKAEKGLKALVQATKMEIAMDPSQALIWGGGGAGKGFFTPGSGLPMPLLEWLAKVTSKWIVHSPPPALFSESGGRILTVAGPHPGADYWHINSDLRILDQAKGIIRLNHYNIEPAMQALTRAYATTRHLVSGAANWLSGTMVDPFLPIPVGPMFSPLHPEPWIT